MENESLPTSGEAMPSIEPALMDSPPQPNPRLRAGLLAAAILALPIGYVVTHLSSPRAVMASQPQAPAAPDIPALEAAARTNPSSNNRINLSLAYINGGASNRAIPVLLSVVADEPMNTIAWNDLCVAQTLEKNYAGAIDDCDRALTIEPNYQLARNNLKWASDEKNKTLALMATTEKAARGHDGNFYLNKGLEELHVGDYDQAIVSWQRTLQLDPKSALAANNIGTAYMMKKHTTEAVVWFNKALQLDPNLQLAKNNLAWARQEMQSPKP